METRREFLRRGALLTGAVGLSGPLLESIERAAAIAPAPGSSFWDAEHVVILMQENRSFDHAYGTLRGVRGFDDPRALTLPDGLPVWVQANDAGESYVPFRLHMRDSRATWMGDLPHNWTDQTDARNGGLHNRWLEAKRSGVARYADMPLTLGYYTREDLPFYYELADAFTICDQHFCSSLTATTPNRLYLWSGTIRAEQRADSPACVLNSDADYAREVSWTTFPERLEDLGVSWKVYQNEVWVGAGLPDDDEPWLTNFGDNPLEYFSQFNVRFVASHRRHLDARLQAAAEKLAELRRQAAEEGLEPASAALLAERIALAAGELREIEAHRDRWSQVNFDRLPDRARRLHAKAFATNADDPSYHELEEYEYQDGAERRSVRIPRGDLFHQFRRDVAAGALPAVSWLVAPERFSDHPCSPWYGAWYIAEALDILTSNPEVWKRTIFILTYDENDGYFDHVPPFVAPHPRRPETGKVSAGIDVGVEYVELEDELRRKPADAARESPIGLGYRVPLVIASPWSRGGCVCSQVFDHTSVLQFLERLLSHKTGREVREPNISEWRRTVCGDLTSVFQDSSTDAAKGPSFPPREEFVAQIHRAQYQAPPTGCERLTSDELEVIRRAPRDAPRLPRQEPGVRRSAPLPYELAAEGWLASEGDSFALEFSAGAEQFGAASAGAPFIVYARLGDGQIRVRNYAVRAGERLHDSWPLAEFVDGRYWLEVYGPNGFYRAFRGGADDPTVEIRMECQRSSDSPRQLSGNVEVRLVNRHQSRALAVDVADRTYGLDAQRIRVAPGGSERVAIASERSHGWYDLHVRIDGAADFERRYAGRVETGRWSYSDPALGRAAT